MNPPSHDGALLRVGVIGCGGRGTGAAEDALNASPSTRIVALADAFEDRVRGARGYLEGLDSDRIAIEDRNCFTGLDAFRRLLDTEVDYVVIAGPPGFRPLHLEAAIDAGKHVFTEKPVGVDPAGIRRVRAAGRRAADRKLGIVAGTQRRHQKSYIETIARIRAGAIGKLVSGRCFWNQGGLWHRDRKPDDTDMSWQLRNWLYFDWLSGDHIVEQHVHNLDVMNWVFGSPPLAARGVGGRQVRTDPVFGNIYDHFFIDFEYAGGGHVMSMCRQMPDTDGFVGEEVTGTAGRADPARRIEGKEPWRFEGSEPNPYVQEHADLIASIEAGQPLNEADQVADATLTAILGREAAYTGRRITWDEILASDLDLTPQRLEFGPVPIRPVPRPGAPR